MPRSRSTSAISRAVGDQRHTDCTRELRSAIEHTGYHPQVVAESVLAGVAGEPVISYYVHHETSFDRDEVRRHITVVVLTPTRLIRGHTDEHPGDDIVPQPYTSTSTEAIALSSVKSVVVTRIATTEAAGAGSPAPPVEAVVTIGWGALSRIDLEPAGCSDQACEADHGYTGVLGPEDFSLRASEVADGDGAVARLLGFAEELSARTRGA
ncbi:MAG: DUF5998 family protein [Nocardioides sp.]